MTKRVVLAALCAVLLSAAARAEEKPAGTEFSVSLGAGLAYELLGLNLTLRRGHLEGFLGLGLLSILPGVAFGGRYFLRLDGTAFFLSLDLGAHGDTVRIDKSGSTGGQILFAALAPGYRLAFGGFFLQAAIGVAVILDETYWRTAPLTTGGTSVGINGMLGAGWRF